MHCNRINKSWNISKIYFEWANNWLLSNVTWTVFHREQDTLSWDDTPKRANKWLITGFVTRLTRRVSLVEQELPTLPEHLRSPPVFSGVRVTLILVLYVCFVDRCLSFCTFSFDLCLLTFVLSVFLRLTGTDYHFYIFNIIFD